MGDAGVRSPLSDAYVPGDGVMVMVNPNARVKTTIMVPRMLLREVDEMGRVLGTGRNGLLSMAAGMLLVVLAPLRSVPVRRKKMLGVLSKEFQSLLDKAMGKA